MQQIMSDSVAQTTTVYGLSSLEYRGADTEQSCHSLEWCVRYTSLIAAGIVQRNGTLHRVMTFAQPVRLHQANSSSAAQWKCQPVENESATNEMLVTIRLRHSCKRTQIASKSIIAREEKNTTSLTEEGKSQATKQPHIPCQFVQQATSRHQQASEP